MRLWLIAGPLLGLVCLGLLASPWPYVAPLVVCGLFAGAALYRHPAWGLVGMVALVPLEGLFQGSGVSGAKLLGGALVAITATRLLLRHTSADHLRSNLWRPLLLWLLLLGLSLLYSQYQSVSLSSARELAVGLVLFLVTLVVGRSLDLYWVCRALVVSVAATCIVALVSPDRQAGGRAIGLLADANYFALLIAVALPPALLLVRQASGGWRRLLWGSLTLVLLLGLIRTDSRSGLLVVLLSITLLAWFYRADWQRIRPRHLGFVMLAVGLGGILTAIVLPPAYVDRVKALASLGAGSAAADPSLGRRSSYLLVGADMVRENPLLGAGLGTFPQHYARTGYASGFSEHMGQPDLFRRAHNTYLELFGELGIPAGLLFLLLLAVATRNFFQARISALAGGNRDAAELATHLGVSLLAMSLFLLFLSSPNHKYLWVLLALSSVLRLRIEADLPVSGVR